MPLQDNVIFKSLKKIAKAVHTNKTSIGSIEALETTAKTDLVSAINELKSEVDSKATESGVSEEKVQQIVSGKLTELVGGASEQFDTLKEIQEEIKKGSTAGDAVLQKVTSLETKLDGLDELESKIEKILTTGSEE